MRATTFPLLLVALAAAACSGESAQDNAAGPAAAGPAAAAASGTVAYRCDDGTMLQADYGTADVTVRWANGRSAKLPRAESASTGAGDAFVGESVSLQRTGTGVELHDGDAPALSCSEVPAEGQAGAATASADAGAPAAGTTRRYSCDADTTVTLLADGEARVELPDGQSVSVSRISGSTPPVFTGSSLYLTIEEDGARLSQGDQARELACKPA